MVPIKTLLLFACAYLLLSPAHGQEKKPAFIYSQRPDLPDIKSTIRDVQAAAILYVKNYTSHSEEHDVNSIILDIEKYIDSTPKNNTYADRLLMKEFNPLRHFFLTTANKTTVATMFLYSGIPYTFSAYNDSAVVLYIHSVKDGNTYNLSKMTEKKIIRSVFDNCLSPSLKAMDEFKEGEVKYIALSAYYGCKDTREGAPANVVVPYCLTLLARTSDLQQYAAGNLTVKGLLSGAELFVSDDEDAGELRHVGINAE